MRPFRSKSPTQPLAAGFSKKDHFLQGAKWPPPSLTWNLKTDGFQNESPIPGCHFQVPFELWEGLSFLVDLQGGSYSGLAFLTKRQTCWKPFTPKPTIFFSTHVLPRWCHVTNTSRNLSNKKTLKDFGISILLPHKKTSWFIPSTFENPYIKGDGYPT